MGQGSRTWSEKHLLVLGTVLPELEDNRARLGRRMGIGKLPHFSLCILGAERTEL